MKRNRSFVAAAAAVALFAVTSSISSAGSGHDHGAKAVKPAAVSGDKKAPQTIVDVAVAAGSFKTLVAAVQAAGLVETLKSEGPFTVFAPTDEAFAKLPEGTVEALLNDKEKLTAILTYHVVPGKMMAADVVQAKSLKTAQGQELTVDASKGVKVDGASVVKADITASNGVIHVIDTVVLPKVSTE